MLPTIHQDLITALIQDHPQAMKRIFELYYTPLCSYALRYTGDIAIAEEIASDVMYQIWKNRRNGYRVDTFREYLLTALRNTALNYLKQQQNRQTLADNWAEQMRVELIDETPLDTLIVKEIQSTFENLMDELPEQCRKAFQMSRFDDKTYDEIAAQMQISVNTVKYHIKTALRKLRTGMSEFT